MIVGLATATIVASTRIMKKPTIMAHSAFHGFSGRADTLPCGLGVRAFSTGDMSNVVGWASGPT